MSGNHPEELFERLRADMTKAEEESRQATTPESKQEALKRFKQALNRYSRLVLHGDERPKG